MSPKFVFEIGNIAVEDKESMDLRGVNLDDKLLFPRYITKLWNEDIHQHYYFKNNVDFASLLITIGILFLSFTYFNIIIILCRHILFRLF